MLTLWIINFDCVCSNDIQLVMCYYVNNQNSINLIIHVQSFYNQTLTINNSKKM